jgi:hypothetical protein
MADVESNGVAGAAAVRYLAFAGMMSRLIESGCAA